eukprot:2591531-Pyramimonas_sp.AAC.1
MAEKKDSVEVLKRLGLITEHVHLPSFSPPGSPHAQRSPGSSYIGLMYLKNLSCAHKKYSHRNVCFTLRWPFISVFTIHGSQITLHWLCAVLYRLT